jgi:hypothetical protein
MTPSPLEGEGGARAQRGRERGVVASPRNPSSFRRFAAPSLSLRGRGM